MIVLGYCRYCHAPVKATHAEAGAVVYGCECKPRETAWLIPQAQQVKPIKGERQQCGS